MIKDGEFRYYYTHYIQFSKLVINFARVKILGYAPHVEGNEKYKVKPTKIYINTNDHLESSGDYATFSVSISFLYSTKKDAMHSAFQKLFEQGIYTR